MEHGGPVLGPAHTRFNDYIGTVAADDAEAVRDQPSLYEIAGIDRDRYTILAVDLRSELGSPFCFRDRPGGVNHADVTKGLGEVAE